jgi:hypothetical protein
MRLLPWVFITLLGLTFTARAEIYTGSSRAEVIEAFGTPRGISQAGAKEILTYAEGRVVLEKGVVVRLDLKGRPPAPVREDTKADLPVGSAPLPPPAVESDEAEKTVIPAHDPTSAAEVAQSSVADIQAQHAFEAAVERMTAEHENSGETVAEDLGLTETPDHFWLEEVVGMLVQIGVGMVILKLAFRWSDVHADWGQMLWPATAAALAGAATRGAAYWAWNTTEVFYLDNAVSYAALLFVLLKTTHACTWQRAVGVAAAAKLMSVVVWVFLSVAISRTLFA